MIIMIIRSNIYGDALFHSLINVNIWGQVEGNAHKRKPLDFSHGLFYLSYYRSLKRKLISCAVIIIIIDGIY